MMPDPYTVKTLVKHPSATVTQVHLEAGHETPRHSHAHDYVVLPRQDATLVKTTYKGDAVVSTETVTHTAGVPYIVSKSEDGTEFTLNNTSTTAMMCDKVLIAPKT